MIFFVQPLKYANFHPEYYPSCEKNIISRKMKYIFTKKLHHNYSDISGYKI